MLPNLTFQSFETSWEENNVKPNKIYNSYQQAIMILKHPKNNVASIIHCVSHLTSR